MTGPGLKPSFLTFNFSLPKFPFAFFIEDVLKCYDLLYLEVIVNMKYFRCTVLLNQDY